MPQLGAQLAQALLGARIRLGLGRIGIDNQVELARQVVDHGQLFAQHQLDVGQLQVVGRRGLGQARFDVAHGVVAEIAGQTAAEARQARAQRDLVALLEGGDEVQRVAFVRLDHAAIGDDLGAVANRAQQRARMQTDEGIAPEALAAHHRFQQEGVRAAVVRLRQLQVQRQRRLQVGQRLGDQRDAVVALVGQRFEFEFGHERSGRFAGRAGSAGRPAFRSTANAVAPTER